MNLEALSSDFGRLSFAGTTPTTTTTVVAVRSKKQQQQQPVSSSPSPSQSPSGAFLSTSPSFAGGGGARTRSRSTSPQPRTRFSSCASPPTADAASLSTATNATPKSTQASLPSPIRGTAPYVDMRVDADGNTPLILAAAAGNFLTVEQALANGATNSVDAQNFRGETALFTACVARRGITAEILLTHGGADPTLCNADGVSPLHVAASLDSERIVRALMGAGASAKARDEEGDTPLHWAIREHAERAARAIVDIAGPDIILIKNDDGETPAELAAEIGDSEAATWLGLCCMSDSIIDC